MCVLTLKAAVLVKARQAPYKEQLRGQHVAEGSLAQILKADAWDRIPDLPLTSQVTSGKLLSLLLGFVICKTGLTLVCSAGGSRVG